MLNLNYFFQALKVLLTFKPKKYAVIRAPGDFKGIK